MKYEKLFSPIKLGRLQLKNRIVFPAVSTQYGTLDPHGYVTDKSIKWYDMVSKGGVGMIVIEAVGVHDRPSGHLLRLKNDSYIDGFRKIVDTIHKNGVPCGVQLVHWLSVSHKYRNEPTTIDVKEIQQITEQYVAAAKRAYAAGVDFVELHAAHAYSFASFLSPAANRRTDEYGGNNKKRAKIVVDTVAAIKKECGNDALVTCRINGEDFVAGGVTNAHAIEYAKMLEEAGCFYLDVSVGGRYEDGEWYTGYSGQRCIPPREYPEMCNLYAMENVKKAVKIPVQGVGRIPMPDVAEKIAAENRVDLVGVCRAIIADPEWPNKARDGRDKDITRCIYCCHCIDTQRHFTPLSCAVWPKDGLQGNKDFMYVPIPADSKWNPVVTYDKIPYAGKGSLYVPHIEHFPARDK